jgi:SAM-dependent methyltransferase
MPMPARPVANDLVHTTCPLCGGNSLRDLGPLTAPRTTQYSSVTIALQHGPTLGQCEACGSRFVQHAIPAATSAALYTEGDAGARWTSNRSWDRMHAPAVVAQLGSLLAPGASLLDVGCNTGELLDFARSRGAVTAGVEYSVESRRRVAGKGHAIFASLDDVRGTFDVVTAFDLFEHLYDAPGFLVQMRALLKPGGRLVILTGDIDCEAAQRDGAGWWYVQPPEHVVFPSGKYWSSVAGFAVESVVTTHNGPAPETGLLASLRARARRLVGAKPRPLPALDHVLVTLSRSKNT